MAAAPDSSTQRPALQVVTYPHPTLRHISKPLRRVDAELREIVREMFVLMYANKGVGLAANQVDLPFRLFIVNLTSDPAKGEELVFINPVITKRKGLAEAEEGCLSLPSLYADVKRPQSVSISAYDVDGNEVRREVTGLFARVVQHELDHLDGILFIDRLSPLQLSDIKSPLEEFEIDYQSRLTRHEIPGHDELAVKRAELELKWT